MGFLKHTQASITYTIYSHIVLGDFNKDPSHTQLSVFMEDYNYYSLIKKQHVF